MRDVEGKIDTNRTLKQALRRNLCKKPLLLLPLVVVVLLYLGTGSKEDRTRNAWGSGPEGGSVLEGRSMRDGGSVLEGRLMPERESVSDGGSVLEGRSMPERESVSDGGSVLEGRLMPERESVSDGGSLLEGRSMLERESVPDGGPGENEIRSHLFQHNPYLPTNYSGGHKGWRQLMPKFIAERLRHKRNGFFIECGALEGVFLSNSLLLEQTYNWTGLLVEADPLYLPVLKGRNRKAWVADVCLSPQVFPIQLDMVGHKAWAGLSHSPNDVVGKGSGYKNNPDYNRKFRVQCFPLVMLLDALGRTEIDYMSLDVEGMELDILKTIPFDRIHIQLISLEVRPANRLQLQDFLVPLGYKKIKNIRVFSDFMDDDVYEFSK